MYFREDIPIQNFNILQILKLNEQAVTKALSVARKVAGSVKYIVYSVMKTESLFGLFSHKKVSQLIFNLLIKISSPNLHSTSLFNFKFSL